MRRQFCRRCPPYILHIMCLCSILLYLVDKVAAAVPNLTPVKNVAIIALTPVYIVFLPLTISVFANIYRSAKFPFQLQFLYLVGFLLVVQEFQFYSGIRRLYGTSGQDPMRTSPKWCGLRGKPRYGVSILSTLYGVVGWLLSNQSIYLRVEDISRTRSLEELDWESAEG